MSFFARTTAKILWKGVTSVSPAGARRGRGRGMQKAKDFSKGQTLGFGRKRLIMPGLNATGFQLRGNLKVDYAGENEEYEEKVQEIRKELDVRKKFVEHPMDRGWSGRKAIGRRAGAPDPHNDIEFEGFDSVVLMLRPLQSMSGTFGRVRRMQALVVTGNRNGLAGFATATGKDSRAVVRHARNRASQALVQIPRGDNHTVLHDFFSRYYFTTVFVERKPKGYGLRAHRAIRAMCDMFGITDLRAKVEGVKYNKINMTKAFFLGLMNQRKYEDMANEKKLHLVELREENYNFPRVLASPDEKVLEDSQLSKVNENLDFTYYIYEGRIKQVKAKPPSPYVGTPSWQVYLDRMDYEKNRQTTRLALAVKYGDKKVLDVFPHFRSTANSFNNPKE